MYGMKSWHFDYKYQKFCRRVSQFKIM